MFGSRDGSFPLKNKSTDVRELQQAIGRLVGDDDERPLCEGGGLVEAKCYRDVAKNICTMKFLWKERL